MVTTLLVTLWAGICSIDDSTTQMLRRPLPIATVTGLIMNDVQMGLLIGATLEIMWMGIGNVGAYAAPDIITGTIIGTSLAITSGGGVAAAITLAVPTSMLAQQLLVLFRIINTSLNRWAMGMAERADLEATKWLNLPSTIMIFFIRAIPVFLAVRFGGDIITQIVENLPAFVMGGLSLSGKLIPAVGISLLMMMMIKDATMWVFLIFGFVIASYLKLSVLPIALIALPFALLYDLSTKKTIEGNSFVSNNNDDEYSEGSYDL